MDALRILGKVWAVREDPHSRIGHNAYGHVDLRAQEIVISAAQHADQKTDTLLHEALHALDHTMSLGLSESQVHGLTGGLLALLRDNPELALQVCGFEVEEEEDASA